MSSTVRLTPLHELDADHVETSRNAHGAGVKILEMSGLKDELGDTLANQMDTRTMTERDEYPRKEWDVLLGFTTWGRNALGEDGPTADYHNVSNTDAEDFARTLGSVSKYTEPFYAYLTSFEGTWPHAAEVDAGQYDEFYRVEADGGSVLLEELTLEVASRETVLDEL